MIFKRPLKSIRLKMLLVLGAVSLLALVVSGTAMMFNDWRSHREVLVGQLNTLADVVSRASAPALSFDDQKAANENLALMAAAPAIKAAALYSAKGVLFAKYIRTGGGAAALPKLPESDGLRAAGDSLVLFKRVIDNNEILGTLYVETINDQKDRMLASLEILLAVLGASMLLAFLVSTQLQKAVTGPILAVADVARQVVDNRDFTLRAKTVSQDETAVLVKAFNAMLDELERRAADLETANRQMAQEVVDRGLAQEALQVSERRYRVLVTTIAAVTWVADTQGAWNEDVSEWTAYTGQRKEEYAGLKWWQAFHADDRATVAQIWERNIAEPLEIVVRLWHQPSGEYRFVSVRAVPNIEGDGTVAEWIGSVSDIHDKRMIEEEVRTLNAELEQRVTVRTAQLEEANHELESFSYSVSHDLRAPVRAVSGFSRILAHDHGHQLGDEGNRLLNIIQGESVRMGALIDDLLTFSRLGRKAIQPSLLNMQDIASSVLHGLTVQYEGTQPTFVKGTLPSAYGDRALITQVWTNLLSNALKFSAKRDQPVIEVGAISEENEYVYFVRDNGAGFDPRYKAKLFGVFQRLHDATEFSGTGVGLALVQRIVTRHGGRVWADSVIDEGATFCFTLPKEVADGRN
ncbi:MAG TPA: ATP-binding protein [Rhodocyclaceae bacterium]|nr:ATP-binding protein [Rhodocyclaceae bacterium]